MKLLTYSHQGVQEVGVIASDPQKVVRFIKTHPEAQPYLNKLGFGKGYELLYCIGFGYPDESPEAKPRDSSKVKFVE